MRDVRRLPALLVACATLAVAPAAWADHRPAGKLWATVNVCDTAAAPNVMGVRGGMPGNGTRQRMYMRFHARWFSRSRQAWFPVAGSGASPWLYVGRAGRGVSQAGYSFQFRPPLPGSTFVVRGVVQFQWRKRRGRRWVVAKRARATTHSGVRGVRAGDPPGRSDGLCAITAP